MLYKLYGEEYTEKELENLFNELHNNIYNCENCNYNNGGNWNCNNPCGFIECSYSMEYDDLYELVYGEEDEEEENGVYISDIDYIDNWDINR